MRCYLLLFVYDALYTAASRLQSQSMIVSENPRGSMWKTWVKVIKLITTAYCDCDY